MNEQPLAGRTIVFGVSGGIAAYKSAELVRLLAKAGARVRVVMTSAATQFVTPLTFQALSGGPVLTSLFELQEQPATIHIDLARSADLILVAPATADLLAKIATGLADDALTTLILAASSPLVLCPAMNTYMWRHPATQENVSRLSQRAGVLLWGPAEGELACGETGPGRLLEPPEIFARVLAFFHTGELASRKILVTAGPTREPIDPVRFISNRSSGKMGVALARQAAARGAQVTLVHGPLAVPVPGGVKLVAVQTAREMAAAVQREAEGAEVIIMAAAVADFTPVRAATKKLKKTSGVPELRLEPTADILLWLKDHAPRALRIGFAAETDNAVAHGRDKLRRKGCQLMVINDVTAPGAGFDQDTNRATLLADDGRSEELPLLSKDELAGRILSWAGQRLAGRKKARRRP